MSAVPTMMNLPLAGSDQPIFDYDYDLFRLAGRPDGIVGQRANADGSAYNGSGFIFANGTFQLLSADECSRYLQDTPLGVSMEMEGPVNRSPQSLPSSIYSLPGLAPVSASEEVTKECQSGFVPPPPYHADGWSISMDRPLDASQLYPPAQDLFPVDLGMPAQMDDSELLAAVFSEAPVDATSTVLPELESTEPETEDAAKHKTLFGNRGWLERQRPPIVKRPAREPLRDYQHNFNLQFLYVTVMDSVPGSGKDKKGNPISMGAGAQAVFYRELNDILVEAVNTFLVQQKEEGRIPQKSINGVNVHWASKGFTPVTDFRWDLMHQRTLVGMTMEALRWAGRAESDWTHLQKVIWGWKILARDAPRPIMGIKDCVADKLVRRHLEDAQDLLEAVNAPEATFTAFAEFSDHAKSLIFS